MTFTFNADTIVNDTLTFSLPNGPEYAYLQLWSQTANQILRGDVVNKTDAWSKTYLGLVLIRTEANSRYTSYKFLYSEPGGLDDFDVVFTKDVQGIYNYKLFQFDDAFIWNLNREEWQLEPREWNFQSMAIPVVIDYGLLKIKNSLTISSPQKVTYQSPNETRSGYVYMTNNSI
jgi:hypothetical protein